MKLSAILSLSATFTAALSFTIQLPHLSDGSYVFTIDEEGKQTWTNVTLSSTTPPTPAMRDRDVASTRLDKRFTWPSGTYPWCPGGDWFVETDFYDHGWSAFYNQCWDDGSYKIPAGNVVTNYQGTSVSYMCAYTANPCSVDEWSDAVSWASVTCTGRSGGWMEPGYLHVPAWNKRYGYAASGDSIC